MESARVADIVKKEAENLGSVRRLQLLIFLEDCQIDTSPSEFPFWRDVVGRMPRFDVRKASEKYLKAIAKSYALYLWTKEQPNLELHIRALAEALGRRVDCRFSLLRSILRMVIDYEEIVQPGRTGRMETRYNRRACSRDARAIEYLMATGIAPDKVLAHYEAGNGGLDDWSRRAPHEENGAADQVPRPSKKTTSLAEDLACFDDEPFVPHRVPDDWDLVNRCVEKEQLRPNEVMLLAVIGEKREKGSISAGKIIGSINLGPTSRQFKGLQLDFTRLGDIAKRLLLGS